MSLLAAMQAKQAESKAKKTRVRKKKRNQRQKRHSLLRYVKVEKITQEWRFWVRKQRRDLVLMS